MAELPLLIIILVLLLIVWGLLWILNRIGKAILELIMGQTR